MPPAVKFSFTATGIPIFDKALSTLGSKPLIRRVVNVPAQRALQPVRGAVKATSKRTHERSLYRPATAQQAQAGAGTTGTSRRRYSRTGPMSRYVSIRGISARSESIGARLFYDTKRFPGFAVYSKAGKRAFYPAAQEYGADNANPAIKKRGQMANSAKAQTSAVRTIFVAKVRTNYEKVAAEVLRKNGI